MIPGTTDAHSPFTTSWEEGRVHRRGNDPVQSAKRTLGDTARETMRKATISSETNGEVAGESLLRWRKRKGGSKIGANAFLIRTN